MTEVVLGIALLGLLLTVNGLATRMVLHDRYAERHQRVFQLLAVWLLPVLGALLVFALHRKSEPPAGYRQSPEQPLDEFTTSRHVGRSIHSQADD